MNIILKYNENKYNYNFDINLEIGCIFENIIDFCELIIYNVENIIHNFLYKVKNIRLFCKKTIVYIR